MTTSQDVLARIDAILPIIGQRGDENDLTRQIDDQTIQSMIDIGVFSVLAPKSHGGFELDLETFSQVVQKVSAAHPSAGWVCSFLTGASWRLLAFGREGQDEIFNGRGYVLGAGTAAPIFDVEQVGGGFVISGRTAWNSGSSHAQWFQINGVVKGDSGAPEIMMFAVPRAEVEILDNWHILGMRGTASCDVVVDKVFVPARRAAAFTPALEGRSTGHRLHQNPIYHVPFLPFAMVEVLPVIVGTHRGAANALRDRVKSRMGTLSGAKASEKVPAQIRMAQAMARAEMAEQMLAAMIMKVSAGGAHAGSLAQRAAIKLHAAMVTDFCLDSVNEMARGVGGDAFRDGSAFQRYFRDINTVARHAFLDADTAAESMAKLELGLTVSDPLL